VRYVELALAAGVAALALTPLVRALATRLGALDVPDSRRAHDRAVPRLGGLALVLACGVTLAIHDEPRALLAANGWDVPALLAGVLVIVATGVLDDVRGLGPFTKLGLEIVAAVVAVAGGYGLGGVTNPLTGAFVPFGAFGPLVTIAWIVGLTNAFNLIDGLDGLATGVGAIAAATLFAIALIEGRTDAACLWATLGGALAGFLPYNFNPASIFLGDAGSLFLGYLFGVLSLQSLQKGATAVVVLAPLLALGLPIMEVGLTFMRRVLVSGLASVLRADREHIHHRLIARGMTHRNAVLTLYVVCAALGGFAFLAMLAQGPGNAVLVAIVAVAMGAAVRVLGYRRPPD
jgi:UDP-GlcNAc:undecaprenyl-phosphate/decaprenyl-phosphate GlcNAc-1-phosphate transferase